MLAQLTERRRRIEEGEASLGWKLGMGVPAAMAKLGTDAPLVGYLLAPARVEDGGTVSLDGWGTAKLEPEIAVHMGADLPRAPRARTPRPRSRAWARRSSSSTSTPPPTTRRRSSPPTSSSATCCSGR